MLNSIAFTSFLIKFVGFIVNTIRTKIYQHSEMNIHKFHIRPKLNSLLIANSIQ